MRKLCRGCGSFLYLGRGWSLLRSVSLALANTYLQCRFSLVESFVAWGSEDPKHPGNQEGLEVGFQYLQYLRYLITCYDSTAIFQSSASQLEQTRISFYVIPRNPHCYHQLIYILSLSPFSYSEVFARLRRSFLFCYYIIFDSLQQLS